MKSFITLVLFCLLCFNVFTQNNNTVLCKKGDNLLNNHLNKIMHQQYAERKKRLKNVLESTISIQAYQDECSKRYTNLLASFPFDIKDSIPTVVSSGNYMANTQWTYYIEKLILDNRITANLYTPKKEGKKSAILFFCGHEMSGKSTESYQKTAILLAQNGFVVMVIDPIGQGERIQLIDSTGKSLTPRATTEHTILNMGATLTAWSVVEEELLDNILCMNYLCSLPEVDTENIGCIGNSGGGAQTTYFSALDTRIKAVACCSWFTKRERMFVLNGPDDGCQYLVNEGREQLEIADYYIMQAPRPILILAGTTDFIDYKGTQEAFKELQDVYNLLKHPKDVTLFSVEDGHGISQPKRQMTVEFFKKYLTNDSLIVKESDLETLPDSALRCTHSGQVGIDFPKEDMLHNRILKIADRYKVSRNKMENDLLDSNQVNIKRLLQIPEKLNPIKANVGLSLKNSLYTEKRIILRRKGQPEMPIRLLTPIAQLKPESEIFVIVNDSGMEQTIHMPIVEKIILSGNIVVLADTRGLGESKDMPDKNNKKFYSEDYRNASLALFIGYPLLGQRVIDIFTILDFIGSEKKLQGKKNNCFGYGNIGVAVRHAYYLDNRIIHIATKDCISSWLDILQNPTEKNRMSLVVPNALMHYDIDLLRRPIDYK